MCLWKAWYNGLSGCLPLPLAMSLLRPQHLVDVGEQKENLSNYCKGRGGEDLGNLHSSTSSEDTKGHLITGRRGLWQGQREVMVGCIIKGDQPLWRRSEVYSGRATNDRKSYLCLIFVIYSAIILFCSGC